MKKIIAFLFFVTLAFGVEQKVVFNLTTSNAQVFENNIIKNIKFLKKNFNDQNDSLSVTVVISGGAYKFFIEDISVSKYKDDADLKLLRLQLSDKLQHLSNEGVIFEACSVGLRKRHINKEVLYPYVKIAPNRTFALIKWQNRGYSYIEVP